MRPSSAVRNTCGSDTERSDDESGIRKGPVPSALMGVGLVATASDLPTQDARALLLRAMRHVMGGGAAILCRGLEGRISATSGGRTCAEHGHNY